MVTQRELQRREERKIDAERMRRAGAYAVEHAVELAGLDDDTATAVAALLEVIADDWKAPTQPRVWDAAVRVAAGYPPRASLERPNGPLPAGYENPHIDRRRRPGPIG